MNVGLRFGEHVGLGDSNASALNCGQFPVSNQNPEQIARDTIDRLLTACGWVVQRKTAIDLNAAMGVAVCEYYTDAGVADYALFVNGKPLGIVEAKPENEGVHLTQVEDQSTGYAYSKLKYLNNDPLPFVYESTGTLTRFTDYRDKKPRSRPVFAFHRPETLLELSKEGDTLRNRLLDLPALPEEGLRTCQIKAITNLEVSFKENRPKALIQMATGSGKTYTAITFIYRLLKFAKAKRVLFLVDTRNLGEQAEQEFMAYLPNDDNRKFTELYGVHRLRSPFIPRDNQVYISTIQRLYSVLKGVELDESSEQENPNEVSWRPKTPEPVEYSESLPIEFFDFIVIDECHRSIYNLWKQVLEYFDAFEIGLTATPDNRTFGFFNQNIVSEYTHQQAVVDGVNVGFDTYLIDTEVTKKGGSLWKGEYVDRREKLSRKKRWQQLDEDLVYNAKQLDKSVVNPNQIRLVVKTFKEHLPILFPDRKDAEGKFEVPKSLIFAKTDSHADDLINIIREEFAEENRFCKKVTYKTEEDPKSVLASFRNEYYPRIAVTVDMIATGTDVKPLEVLLFMRDVRSRNYFEQMKGRGTRTITLDDLKKVTPTAKFTKDHFVIVDAVGVSKSLKTDSKPLDKKPGVNVRDLMMAIAVGNRDEDTFSTLAGRLIRLAKQITAAQAEQFEQIAGGITIHDVAETLLAAHDPDKIETMREEVLFADPQISVEQLETVVAEKQKELIEAAAHPVTGKLTEFVEKVRRDLFQIIDTVTPDQLVNAGWDSDQSENARALIDGFAAWIAEHKNDITALQIFYSQPYRRRELTYNMIKELAEQIRLDRPMLAPLNIWRAYEQLGERDGTPRSELTALVALVRRVCGIDEKLTDYSKTIDRNFQRWVFDKQSGAVKYNEEQMSWLHMIKDHIANSFHIEREDFETVPFAPAGGLGKMHQLFRNEMDLIIDEMNEALAA